MTAKNFSSWLPYGSTDESVILQHPLTSDPTTYFQSLGTLVVTGTPVFDSILGFNPLGSSGFRIQNMANRANCDWGFQISVEVQRDWVTFNDTVNFSSGYHPATGTEGIIAGLPAVGTAYGIFKDTTGVFYGIINGASTGNLLPMSPGKGDFVRINIGATGGKIGGIMYLAVDDNVISSVAMNNGTLSDFLNLFYIGSNRNIAVSYAQRYIRNLQISYRPPMFPVHNNLRTIGILSDSLFSTDSSLSVYNDVITSWTIRRELAKRGLYAGSYTVSVTGGARYSNAGGGVYLHDTLAAVLASNPTILIINGGTNDAAGSLSDDADWETQVMLYITDGFANKFVKMIVLADTPSLLGDSSFAYTKPFVTLGNSRLRNVANTWRANNPTDPRKVVVSDTYNALGGENPVPGTFIGQVSGLFTNLHCCSMGHYLRGKALTDTVVNNLGSL